MLSRESFKTNTVYPTEYNSYAIAHVAEYILSAAKAKIPLENNAYKLVETLNGTFGLFKEDELLGWVKLGYRTINNTNYRDLEIAYIIQSARKTRAFLILINAIKQVVNLPILIDGAVFDDGVKAISALHKRENFKVNLIDLNTGELSDFEHIPQSAHIGIVVEGWGFPIGEMCEAPGGFGREYASFKFF